MSFKRLDAEDITISADSVVAPAWSGQVTNLTTFITASSQATVNRYYYDIYQTASNATGAAVQFSLAFGNRLGSGSQNLTPTENGKSPSSIVYGQYRTLINGDENTDFIFGDVTPNSVFIISVNRARFKEKLLPGSFNLTLTSGSTTLNLTDNSETLNTISYTDSGRVYDIVSGSNGIPYTTLNALGYTVASGSYGKFLPDVGVIVLNAEALKAATVDGGLGMTTVDETSATSLTSSPNLSAFYNIIKAGESFKLQSEETITSDYIFVRVRNGEFNYSTNPSNITGSGELRHNIMINSPQTYITTVGLYNDNNDLLGVAKLSRPLLKDFTKEALVRIKLDY